MIIVDQVKSEIFNFDNIKTIWIGDENPYYSINADDNELGRYNTPERAREILQEIIATYRKFNLDNNKAVTIIPKVYEMPKE